MAGDAVLAEQRRLESRIGWIRWGAVALIVVLGPLFPDLSVGAVMALGVAVAAYNVIVLRLSAAAPTTAVHRRVAATAFGADLAALSCAMFLFSNDPQWTTFVIGPVVVIAGAFRFGGPGAYVSAAVLSAAYLAISVFRSAAFGFELAPQRMAFHLSVFALSAVLMERVLHDVRQVRAEREELVLRLEHQLDENERLGAEASEARALRELDRLKDELLAAVSHELRTPLTVIRGSLELLARDRERLGARGQRLIERAEAHTRRLDRSVEDLLELAQLQEARIDLERELVDAGSLLREAAGAHEPVASAKKQRVVVRTAEGTPLFLADRRRFLQVVGNLLQNATRYAPAGTAIEAAAEPAETRIAPARVDAVLQRHHAAAEQLRASAIVRGGLRIDLARREVTVGGRSVRLTPTEYSLLYHLATNAGAVMTHRELLAKVWGPEYRDEVHYLKVYVARLRNKIEEDPQRPVHIETSRGIGYRFPAPQERGED